MKLLTFKRRIGLKCGLDEFELTIYTFYFLFNDECWISIEGWIWVTHFFLCLPFILYLVFYSHTWPRLIIEKIENVKSLRCLLRSCKEWSGWFDEVYIQNSFNFSLHHVTINLQSVSKEIPRLNSTALKNCFSWNIKHLNLWAYCINIVHTLFIWIIFFQLSFNINPQFVYKLGADYTL